MQARTPATCSPRFLVKQDYPIVFATTPKTGSSSLTMTLKRLRFKALQGDGTMPENKQILLIVRHPLDRLVSAYNWFVVRNDIKPNSCKPFRGASFEQFVNYTENKPNQHWEPQTWQHTDWRSYWGLIPLERLNDWWPDELGPLDWRKKTDRLEWPAYYTEHLRERCEKRYAEDIEAYEQACDTGVHTLGRGGGVAAA